MHFRLNNESVTEKNQILYWILLCFKVFNSFKIMYIVYHFVVFFSSKFMTRNKFAYYLWISPLQSLGSKYSSCVSTIESNTVTLGVVCTIYINIVNPAKFIYTVF